MMTARDHDQELRWRELFENARDLEVTIVKKRRQFGFLVTRGPSQDFRPLIDGDPYATLREVLNALAFELESIRLNGHLAMGMPRLVSASFDPAQMLSPEIIDQIIDDLIAKGQAMTYRYPLAA